MLAYLRNFPRLSARPLVAAARRSDVAQRSAMGTASRPGPARSRRDLARFQPEAERTVRAPRGRWRRRSRRARARRGSAAGRGLLLGLIVAVWLASGFYIVDEGQRGIVLRFGKFVETTHAGPALAPAVSDRDRRNGEPGAGAHRRGRLPQQRQEQGAEGIADADRRREHRRRPVRGAVHAEEPERLSVQQPLAGRRGAAGGGDRDPRDRRQEQHGLRALRGPRRGRRARAQADAGDPRPLRHRHQHQQGDDAERAAAASRCRRRSTTR